MAPTSQGIPLSRFKPRKDQKAAINARFTVATYPQFRLDKGMSKTQREELLRVSLTSHKLYQSPDVDPNLGQSASKTDWQEGNPNFGSIKIGWQLAVIFTELFKKARSVSKKATSAGSRHIQAFGHGSSLAVTFGNTHYLLNPQDIPCERNNLYKSNFSIGTRGAQELHFERWLGPDRPPNDHANDDIRDAILHYSPMTAGPDSRFELIIASKDICSHGNVILIDGTFSLTLQEILLFVLMGIHELYHGIPLAMFHFSPP
ncbi:hypothetical protein BDK51DRAFT_30222 [Blyttiomyces helicus]|uniref:Uncharacterized protein n=1 Tax=Blyttiomyces helicus TaxID=388810 RepID=A0A4P9WM10_9FUNG|nr:hypothetical protein BDK51DRAFT_30222 [Blyttiomyces helicus]|eukprot:RKO91726.1 hypothetical protein BDK51DRAFT_30222 [Blyttiomyces helicus]